MTETIYTSAALSRVRMMLCKLYFFVYLRHCEPPDQSKEEPKKSSIHLVHNGGFAGVHPRKSYLYLNLRTDHPIESPRIAKTEQVSKNRFHNEFKLISPDELDEELLGWLKEAYVLG